MKFYPTKITHLLATLLLFFFLSITSCRTDEQGDQCFDNRTDEPIDLYINGFFELTINEGDASCIFLGPGCWDWYAEGVVSGSFLEGTVCLGNGFLTTIIIE